MQFRVLALSALFSFATLAALLPSSENARAGVENCLFIANKDRRAYCIALAKGDPASCLSIQNQDFRFICLAQTKSQKASCLSIHDRDMRNQCLSMF